MEAVRHAASTRRFRLAVRLILDLHRGVPLPADETALKARHGSTCLDVPHAPCQTYERLADRRFRIAVPAHAPAARFFTPSFVTPPPPPPKGAPADADRIGNWSLEITVREPRPRPAP